MGEKEGEGEALLLHNLSVAGFAATAPLVGEALADRRVFEGIRFAPICSADVLSCLAAVSGFGASATRWKSESYAKGSPTRGGGIER